ncbi:hypothetical protein D0T87_24170, partial [Bacteroides sp. 51]|nr:hypothetical protein [Bacteroides sp. 51]
VDDIKNAQIGEDGYITIPEACAMFNVDRDTIYTQGSFGSSYLKGVKCALSVLGVCISSGHKLIKQGSPSFLFRKHPLFAIIYTRKMM